MMSVDQSQIMDAKEMIGLHAVDVVYCRAQKDHVPGWNNGNLVSVPTLYIQINVLLQCYKRNCDILWFILNVYIVRVPFETRYNMPSGLWGILFSTFGCTKRMFQKQRVYYGHGFLLRWERSDTRVETIHNMQRSYYRVLFGLLYVDQR